MKSKFFFLGYFLYTIIQLQAIEVINCKEATYIPVKNQHPFLKDIVQSVNHKLRDSHQIQCNHIPRDETFYRLYIDLKKSQISLNTYSVVTEIIEPNGYPKNFAVLSNLKASSVQHKNRIVQGIADKIFHIIQIEFGLVKGNKLDNNFFKNQFLVEVPNKNLDIQVMAKKAGISKSPLPQSRHDKQRIQDKHNRVLFKTTKKEISKLDLDSPIYPDPPKILNEPNPFQKDKKSKTKYLNNMSFSQHHAAGYHSVILYPSLTNNQTDLMNKFSLQLSTLYAKENMSEQSADGVHTLNFNGNYFAQLINFGTHLWKNIYFNIQTGVAAHDSEVQMDLPHPTAKGSTTFLSTQKLDTGLTDTQISVYQSFIQNNLILRPTLNFKIPTGRSSDFLGSGHADLAAGLNVEYVDRLWHYAMRFSFVKVGKLDVFDKSQGTVDLSDFITLSFGIGREFNSKHNESVSIAFNYSENPYEKVTSFSALTDQLMNVGALWERNISKNTNVLLDTNMGLTDASPKFALQLSFKYSH